MVVFNLFTALVLVPIVGSLSPSEREKEYPFLKTEINDEKHAVAFNKLLNSIVKVNQKRLDAIKKLTKLQATDFYPTLEDTMRSDTKRRDSDESDSESNENKIIYLVIPETPHNASKDHTGPSVTLNGQNASNPNIKIRKPDPKPQISGIFMPEPLQKQTRAHDSKTKGPNTTISQISISRDGLDALRQSIERSCRSREVKKCKYACKAAVKSACDVYDCRKKLKKKLKKECKRECKAEFKGSW